MRLNSLAVACAVLSATFGQSKLVSAGTLRAEQAANVKVDSTLSAQEVFSRVSPSVFIVESLDANGSVKALGSAIVIAPDHVVTNRHVIAGAAGVRLEREGKTWHARIVNVNADHDLAELDVPGLNAPPVVVRDSSSLRVGERVYAIGAPEGLELTISEGLISGLRPFGKATIIQTSAAVSPGSSGGGLFDTKGRLVGLTTFQLVEGQNLNFALPAEWAITLNGQLSAGALDLRGNSPRFQATVWFEAGVKDHETGNNAEAVRAFQKAVDLKPDAWEAWYDMGMDYIALGRDAEAATVFQQAARLNPDYEPAWENLGAEHNKLSAYSEALIAEWHAIRLDASDANAWINLGSAWDGLGRYKDAVSAGQKAVHLKPNDATAWCDLGTFYGDLGQQDNAVKALREAIRIKPDLTEAWYNLGVQFKATGEESKVAEVYEKLKVLDPKLADRFYRRVIRAGDF